MRYATEPRYVQVGTLLAAVEGDEAAKAVLVAKLKKLGIVKDHPAAQDRKDVLWCGHTPESIKKTKSGIEWCEACGSTEYR